MIHRHTYTQLASRTRKEERKLIGKYYVFSSIEMCIQIKKIQLIYSSRNQLNWKLIRSNKQFKVNVQKKPNAEREQARFFANFNFMPS